MLFKETRIFTPTLCLEVTDDHDEMEKIGREIFKLNPVFYTDRSLKIIHKTIDRYSPNATAKEKENLFYRSIYDYWVYGNDISREFFYDFFNKTHEEKSEYLTVKNYLFYCHHLNNSEESRRLLDNKYGTYQFLKEYYRRDVILITGEKDYDSFCDFAEKHSEFVVKPLDFLQGLYVHKESTADYKNLRELFNKLLKEKKLIGADETRDIAITFSGEVDLVLEEVIEQVPEMAKIHPPSLNLIRIVTVRVPEDIKIFVSYFSVGLQNKFVNNTSFGYLAMVDSETGIVTTDLFNKKEFFKGWIERHPETNIKVRGFQIPHWQELIALVKEMSNKFENINYIGWDLALTPKGWCVIEANDTPALSQIQIIQKRGLKKEFEELIGWKPDKEFWWQ